MKCPHCLALVMATDDVCVKCHQRVDFPGQSQAQIVASTPQWAYVFAALCGVLPVLTLGGFVPILIGFGGAGVCLQTARSYSIPAVLRFLVCVGITVGAWLVVGLLVLAIFAENQRR